MNLDDMFPIELTETAKAKDKALGPLCRYTVSTVVFLGLLVTMYVTVTPEKSDKSGQMLLFLVLLAALAFLFFKAVQAMNAWDDARELFRTDLEQLRQLRLDAFLTKPFVDGQNWLDAQAKDPANHLNSTFHRVKMARKKVDEAWGALVWNFDQSAEYILNPDGKDMPSTPLTRARHEHYPGRTNARLMNAEFREQLPAEVLHQAVQAFLLALPAGTVEIPEEKVPEPSDLL